MAATSTAVVLYGADGRAISVHRRHASAFDAAGSGRRTKGWAVVKDDVNSLIFSNVDILRDRCRDVVRKNPWAENALSGFVANAIGVGIKPQSQHPNPDIRKSIHALWRRWTDEADATGLTDFYGLQRLGCRTMREGGEGFVRFRYRRSEDGLSVPLQLQLLEAEHVPTYNTATSRPAGNNQIRMGIEFDAIGRRAAYHMYREHPGASVFFGLDNQQTTRVPADQVLALFEPLRPGQIRGLPWFTSVLLDLWELEQYSDAQLVKQKVAAMFVGWLKKTGAGDAILPEENQNGSVAETVLEPGTYQTLLPGEDMEFADPPDAGSYAEFVRVQLRAIAAGLGITYEMLTGDLTGVNYSSIRAGLLEFRRRCEAFQHQVMVFQFCRPVFKAWLRTAWLAGAIDLPGYEIDPYPYEDVEWTPPGFDWTDPLKDVTARILEIRAGLNSRSRIASSRGDDSESIDVENAADNARADGMGLRYTSDGRNPENGGSTQAATDSQKTQQFNPDDNKAVAGALRMLADELEAEVTA
jgi:lambda family phage portal protein